MPTYEYECTKCGRIFEEFHSITKKALKTINTDCRKCNNRAPVRRLIGTGGGVIFKGSGFYETDYRSESYKKAAKAEKEAISGSSDKKDGDTKAGDKPAAKGEKSKKKPGDGGSGRSSGKKS